uniref:Cupin-like domain-containing protein n=1 Tax=Clastoptera arizonana TaxID=38151 RepID=A0A1B6DNQ4_9HEMI
MSKQKKIKHSLKPLDLKKYILNSKEPFVIHGFYKSWDIVNWSLQKWSQELGEQKLKFRVGLKMCQKTPQWESTCKSKYSTFEEFIRKADEIKDEWVYFDYKYVHEHFSQDSPILQGISWTDLGFEGKGGKDSTIWIGSEGANTPCHMDTYGCNIVAQVYGRYGRYLYHRTRARRCSYSSKTLVALC